MHDLARVRLDNALLLFDEFVQHAVRRPDAATLRGLEGRFAERLQIQPSYWSQIKSRSRHIGERLARQFEERMGKPKGWMDSPQRPARAASPRVAGPAPDSVPDTAESLAPATDDERFIVGIVLTYYRRHPARARARLLELLGEVLMPVAQETARGVSGAAPPEPAGDADVWRRSQRGVAPLKRKR